MNLHGAAAVWVGGVKARPATPVRPPAWLLPLIALCLLLPDLGSHAVRREKELRVVLTARDMVQTGRWLEPHYRDELRLRKPPLMYWLVGGVYGLGAPVTSAAWSRLPSALCGVGLVCTIYLLGCRLMGRRRAFAAAIVASMSFIVLQQGKLAETDMCLSLCVSSSALAGALALSGRSSRWWLLALACAGIGFLVKGPASLVLPPAAWLAFAWRRRGRVASPFRQLPFWLGLALCVAIAAPWYLAVHARAGSAANAQVSAELSALLTSSKHTQPVVYYLYATLIALAPWSPLLPFALWYGYRRGHRRSGWGFPLTWLTSSVVILSCLSSKQAHYTTLLVAPAALLIGAAIHARHPALRPWSRRTALLVTILLMAGSVILLGGLLQRVRPLPMVPTALCLAALILVLVPRTRTLTASNRLVVSALAFAALLPAGSRLVLASGSHGTATRWVAEETMRVKPREAPLVCLGPLDACAAFYADQAVRFAPDLDTAWSNAAPGTYVIATWKQGRRPTNGRLPQAPLLQRTDRSTIAAVFIKPAEARPLARNGS